jgi:hypothetical protein
VQPVSSIASIGPAGPAASAASVALRPEPGLARGVWEAPPWAFVTALAGAVIAALVCAAWTARGLRNRKAAR